MYKIFVLAQSPWSKIYYFRYNTQIMFPLYIYLPKLFTIVSIFFISLYVVNHKTLFFILALTFDYDKYIDVTL